MEARTKRRLGNRFAGSPFIRLFLFDPWFRAAVGGFLCLLLLFPLFLLRIWRASPPHFLPVIKVSGLDLAQAWSLKRSAQKAADKGQHEDAHYAWVAALANNLADAGAVRGALQTVMADRSRSRHRHTAAEQALWLLRLSRTNVGDLVLASKILNKFGHHDRVAGLLEAQVGSPIAVEAEHLKALFHLGKMDAFGARWQRIDATALDPQSALYGVAYFAGWGPVAVRTANSQRLEAAQHDPELRTLACRLGLILSSRRVDAERYRAALANLEQSGDDTLAQHLAYARLLALLGRKDEAAEIARNCSRPPEIPGEAIAQAQLCFELGLQQHGLQLLKQYGADFGDATSLWVFYAAMLIRAEQWDELRRAAFQMRLRGAQTRLIAYSHFLEGRSDVGLKRDSTAATAFQKMLEWEFHHPKLGMGVAAGLLQLGHAPIARELLQKLEAQAGEDLQYWKLLFQTAENLKDEPLMLLAGAKAFELQPGDPVVANNRAVALLIARERSEEALSLTLQVQAGIEAPPAARINHALALLRNGRLAEAEALLQSIDPGGLTPDELSLYYLDLFELCCLQQRYADAWLAGNSIEPEHLFPSQRQWFEQAMQSFPVRPAPEMAER